MELLNIKYSVSELGTKPNILKKSLDKTDLNPVIQDLFALTRELVKLMSKHDQNNIGKLLYDSVLDIHTHFAMSYYHVGITEQKCKEAYQLVVALENTKFLLDEVFRLNMIHDTAEHVKGFKNRTYILVANVQEQIDKWYNWLVTTLHNRTHHNN